MEKTFKIQTLKVSALGLDCKYEVIKETEEGTEAETHAVKLTRPVTDEILDLYQSELPRMCANLLHTTLKWDIGPDVIEVEKISIRGKERKVTFKLVVDSPYDSESNKGAFRIATPAIFEDDTILEGIIYGLEIAVQRYIEGESREVEVFGDEA